MLMQVASVCFLSSNIFSKALQLKESFLRQLTAKIVVIADQVINSFGFCDAQGINERLSSEVLLCDSRPFFASRVLTWL